MDEDVAVAVTVGLEASLGAILGMVRVRWLRGWGSGGEDERRVLYMYI